MEQWFALRGLCGASALHIPCCVRHEVMLLVGQGAAADLAGKGPKQAALVIARGLQLRPYSNQLC